MLRMSLLAALAAISPALAQTAGDGSLFYMVRIYSSGATPERTTQMDSAEACTKAVQSLQPTINAAASSPDPRNRVIIIAGCR
jgi:3-hydroxy-3-methylglutaryl CoA synthase